MRRSTRHYEGWLSLTRSLTASDTMAKDLYQDAEDEGLLAATFPHVWPGCCPCPHGGLCPHGYHGPNVRFHREAKVGCLVRSHSGMRGDGYGFDPVGRRDLCCRWMGLTSRVSFRVLRMGKAVRSRWLGPLLLSLSCLLAGFGWALQGCRQGEDAGDRLEPRQKEHVLQTSRRLAKTGERFLPILRQNCALLAVQGLGTASFGFPSVPYLFFNGYLFANALQMAKDLETANHVGRGLGIVLFLHAPLEFLAIVVVSMPGFRLALDFVAYLRNGGGPFLSATECLHVFLLALFLLLAAAVIEAFVVPRALVCILTGEVM